MRIKETTYLGAGLCLALGALVCALSIVFYPMPTPAGELAAGALTTWKFSVLALFAGTALMGAGSFVVMRHFLGTDSEILMVLSLMCLIFGGAAYMAGIPGEFVALYGSGIPTETRDAMWSFWGVATAGRVLCWGSLILTGIALTREKTFPVWLPLLGIIIGALDIVAEALYGPTALLAIAWFVGFAWLFLFGVMILLARGRLAGIAEPALATAGK